MRQDTGMRRGNLPLQSPLARDLGTAGMKPLRQFEAEEVTQAEVKKMDT